MFCEVNVIIRMNMSLRLSAVLVLISEAGALGLCFEFSAAKFSTRIRFTSLRKRLLPLAHTLCKCSLASRPIFSVLTSYDSVTLDAARPVATFTKQLETSLEKRQKNSSIFFL